MRAQSLIEGIKARLTPLSETAGLDAQVLLAHVIGSSRAWVLAHPEACLTEEQNADVERLMARLEQGEPLPYVLGTWEFYGLAFAVSPAALIPRPETELMVETALAWLRSHPGRRLAAEVGTGSGCVAVALAKNCPDVRVVASDLSWDALELAQRNVSRHGVMDRVGLVQADLLAPSARGYDLICANLPYIPSDQLRSLRVSRWEPRQALDGGEDGLAQIRRLLRQAPEMLAGGGLALLEIEERQGERAEALARRAFPEAKVRLLKDLAGRDRLLRIVAAS